MKKLKLSSVVLLSLFIVAVSCFSISCSSKKYEKGDLAYFKAFLEKDGFTVQQGKLEFFDITQMYDKGYIPSCWGNNSSTPYMIFKLPASPDQEAPNTISDAVIDPENKGLWGDLKLRHDEAVVYIGNTPPDADYFSYKAYLAMRYLPEDEESKNIFASLGDTVNNMSIKTSGTPDGNKGNPFSEKTIIIFTSDKSIDSRIRVALKESGYLLSIVNTDVIPSSILNMGLEKESDSFAFIHRIAFFKDTKEGNDYLNNSQGTVLRLTPKKESAADPFPVQNLKVRGTGDAFELNLIGALDELREAIIKEHGKQEYTEFSTSMWLSEGFDAIQRGVGALGENRDTFYLKSENFYLRDNPDEFLIVYGVNHAASGKAVYSNFGIYGADVLNGIGAVSNHDFTGTAEEYLPGNPLAKYLYVWKVARNAESQENCLDVKWGIGAKGIDINEQCFIGFKGYLEEKTGAGPDLSEILYDRVIKFE